MLGNLNGILFGDRDIIFLIDLHILISFIKSALLFFGKIYQFSDNQ